MADAKTQEDMVHYLFHLRTLPVGELDARPAQGVLRLLDEGPVRVQPHPPEVETWFRLAGRAYADGNSYANFMKNFLAEAVVQPVRGGEEGADGDAPERSTRRPW